MAGSPRGADLAAVRMPIYLIHSPDDEVVPFAGAEEAYRTLSARGHPVELRVLPGYGHYMMGAYVPALRLAGTWMLERWSEDGR
jgi:dipeptidyl aminopeptidase/acylaminoacyl peptidase